MNITSLWMRSVGLSFVLVGSFAAFADEADDYINAAMSRQHIPGLTLAVIRDGKIIKSQAYGLASVE